VDGIIGGVRVLVLDLDAAAGPTSGERLVDALTADGAVVDLTHDPLVAGRVAADGGCAVVVACVETIVPASLDWCREVRDSDVGAAILVVADHAEPDLVVAALDAGADDCVTRPVRLGEITARVRAVVRRGGSPRHVELRVGSLRLDPAAHRVWRGDDEIDTTATEFALLAELMRHPGQVLSRAELLDLVWGREESETSNVVDQAVARLRRLVDEPFDLATLETVRGVGYRLADDDTIGAPMSEGAGVDDA